jgi:uncharacterized protein YPO0396
MALGTAAALSLGLQGAKALAGGVQMLAGRKKLKNLETPQYQVSNYARQNLQQAQMDLLDAKAGEDKAFDDFQDRQQAQLAEGLQNNPNIDPQALIDAQNKGVIQKMQIDNDEIARARGAVTGARQAMAQEEQMAFQINQLDPYNRQLQTGQDMLGAGMQNIGGALDSAASNLIDSQTNALTNTDLQRKAAEVGMTPRQYLRHLRRTKGPDLQQTDQ